MQITFETILNKIMLIGISYVNESKEIIKQVQFAGKIVEASQEKGIIVKTVQDNRSILLPPDLSAIQQADPGEYKLKSTGEVILNPDLISTWISEKEKYAE